MNHNREQILKEILEHTIDCDYNRSQHFIDYKGYKIGSDVLNFVQIIALIGLIIFYTVLIPEKLIQNDFLKYIIPISLSLIATIFQLIDYFFNISDLADQHWLAAQAYSRLYRQCQFFPSHYGVDCDEHIMREAAHNICNELFDLNLMSPHLSKRSYKKAKESFSKAKESFSTDKKYPIQSIIDQSKIESLKQISEKIQYAFSGYKIEIVSFGSYITSFRSSDIDIAIVVHSDDCKEDLLFEKVMNLEREFNKINIKVDLTLLMPSRLRLSSQIPFIKNIKNGQILFASEGIFKSIKKYEFDLEKFKNYLKECYKFANTAYYQSDDNNYINKAYYYVKNVICFFLLMDDKTWTKESEMVELWKSAILENTHLKSILDAYLLFKKYKDNETSVGIDYSLNPDEKEKLHKYITEVNTLLDKKLTSKGYCK